MNPNKPRQHVTIANTRAYLTGSPIGGTSRGVTVTLERRTASTSETWFPAASFPASDIDALIEALTGIKAALASPGKPPPPGKSPATAPAPPPPKPSPPASATPPKPTAAKPQPSRSKQPNPTVRRKAANARTR